MSRLNVKIFRAEPMVFEVLSCDEVTDLEASGGSGTSGGGDSCECGCTDYTEEELLALAREAGLAASDGDGSDGEEETD